MAEGGRPTLVTENNKINPVTQTLNVISQKVIQVNKPAEYYRDKKRTKIFIY